MDLSFIFYILIAILVFMVMITIHEAGHYVAGKILKFKINEFAIGFGPAIISKTNKTTGEKFSLRALPLGGFCAFEDEEGLEEDNKEVNPFEEDKVEEVKEEKKDELKPFVKQPPWKRIIVLISGGLANLLSAFIFSFIFILIVGYAVPSVKILQVNPDTGVNYAQELCVGDKIIAVDGTPISVMNSYDELMSSTGNDVSFTVIRNGETLTILVKKQTVKYENLDKNGVWDGTYTSYANRIGFSIVYNYEKDVSLAFKEFIPYTFKLAFLVLNSIFMMFTGQIPITEMTGTIGTVAFMAEQAQADWRSLFLLLPLIASNLGIFNLLPIPALDGSKVVFTAIEWIRGKPVSRKVESIIHMVGIIALLSFVVIIDILHFIT